MQVEQYQARNTQLEREHEHRVAEREALRLEFEHKLDERMRLELKQQELEYEGRIKVQQHTCCMAGRSTCRSWPGGPQLQELEEQSRRSEARCILCSLLVLMGDTSVWWSCCV